MLKKRIVSAILSQLLVLGAIPLTAQTAFAASNPTLTFSNSAITETVSGSGYSISGTTLNINAAGVYKINGKCSAGNITVSKNLKDVVLIFDDLSLSAKETAPVIVKKGSNVTIHLEGTSTLTDNENAAEEETNENFEGAAIKAKSGSTLTFCGDGKLNVNGNAKNGIKGAAESTQIFNGGNFNVTAVNNGIAADGSITFNNGDFTIDVDNDGIKSVPDATDTISSGSITINGGNFYITADGDGIQAEDTLKITNGNFNIKTLGGYNDSSFNSDTMSCKGLKVSGDRENITNNLMISGGTFTLNTADDAIHSDTNATITGGTYRIDTGDDGVHSDTLLNLGTENGLSRDPEFYINSSYEGLESSVVNMYSGKYYVVSSDDGINAAGGSSSGTDPRRDDRFRPDFDHGGGGGRGGNSNYSLNIYGGSVYVDALGDGLDSNGALNLNGGNITVFSQARGGDNSPLDSDGTMTINGATVFAAGTNPMNENPSTSSQSYYKQTTYLSAGTVVDVKNGNTVLYSDKLLRNINYLLYSEPNISSSSVSVSTSSSVDHCHSNSFAHNWNSGKIITNATESTDGKMVYTCQDCGAIEYKKIAAAISSNCDGHDSQNIEVDKGHNVTFATDSHSSINVYYGQDYTSASETNVTTTVSRNAATGDPDSTGEGQVNFKIVVADGYEVDTVTVEGGYKNLKDISADTSANTYRVTKITSELTISVTTKKITTTSLENNSSLSAESIMLGETVTAQAKATGGTGTYTYAVFYKKSSSTKWTTVQNYNSNTTVSIKPAVATSYDVCIKVKDSKGTIEKKYFTIKVSYPILVNQSTISSSSITLGNTITAKAKASGGTGVYTYAVFYKKSSSTKWTTVQNYSSNTTVSIKPAVATSYDVCIKVKDSKGTIQKKYFTVKVS